MHLKVVNEIFISYRREDSLDATGRIHDWLNLYFPETSIFRDIDMIRGGQHFPSVLEEALRNCKVLLAIIGKSWAKSADKEGKIRIQLPNDWVRLEISRAFSLDIPVIPVLVSNAALPGRDELPLDLTDLRSLHAVNIDPGRSFGLGLAELVREISRHTGLIPDDYPTVIRECRTLGLVSASLGLLSTLPSVQKSISASKMLLIAMNDGRGFLDAMRELIHSRNRDEQKTTRIVFIHPASPFIDTLIKKNTKRKAEQLGDVRRSFETLRAAPTGPSSIEIRGTYTFLPSSYIICDGECYVSPYLCVERGSLPIFHFVVSKDGKPSFFDTIRDDGESLFRKSVLLTEDDFTSH